ncbi:hypothetical protein [Microbulbifer spongiae]|uniref:Uncharacterized protein n=1 Tax=Microbulbifer spongiae TaxID=2944933 RepID=A0ABY9EEW3_9GAMM|nr:hypothetical protein [Microbulbifer sp. MI-G]WKD51025.1 hypothetical protein M8T91_06285 [Microbulbifer sp. MI-G]
MDYLAGLGDGLLLGFGDDIRGALNIGGVNTESGLYLAEEVTSYAAGVARVGYAATVKIGARLAPSGTAANVFRNNMKGRFRLGTFRSYRSLSYSQALSRYGSDAAVQAAAGRTNIYFNIYGAGILAGGVFGN